MHYISIIIVFHFSFYPLTHRILPLLTSSHLVSLVTPTVWSSSAGHSYCFYNASPFKDWDSPRKKKLSERITVEPALSFLVPKSSIKSWDYIKKWRWVDMWPTYCSQSRCSSNMGKKKKTQRYLVSTGLMPRRWRCLPRYQSPFFQYFPPDSQPS